MKNSYATFDAGRSIRKWDAGSRLPENRPNKEAAGYAINNMRMLNNLPVDDRYRGDVEETGLHSYGPVNPMTSRRRFQGTYTQWEDPARLLHVMSERAAGDNQFEDRGERLQAFSVNPGEPRDRPAAPYGYDQSRTSRHNAFRHNEVENLEMDREELLRKLEELNFQINRSKESERQNPINRNRVPNDPYSSGFTHHSGPVPFAGSHNMELEVRDIVRLHGKFRDPFGPHTEGTSSEYAHNPSNMPFLRYQHVDYINSEQFKPYARHRFSPHPPSSRMILEDPHVPLQHHVNRAYARPSPNSSKYQSPSRTPTEISVESETEHSGGLTLDRPKKDTASNKTMKYWLAIAGGAPFVICSNCFDLLKLPRKLRIKESSREKTRCGSCSAVIHLKLEENRLTVCAVESETSLDEAKSNNPPEVLNEGGNGWSLSHRLSDPGGMESREDDEHNISFLNSEDNVSSREREVNLGRNDKIAGFDSCFSFGECELVEDEGSKKPVMMKYDHTNPNPPGSPLAKFSYNPISMVEQENPPVMEKSSNGLNQEEAFHRKIESPHTSSQSDPEATEVEISSSEYPITSMSQESMDTTREEDHPKQKTGVAGSFIEGLLRGSVKDQPRLDPIVENKRLKVTINGHPVPDNEIVRAEEFAGSILPGDYWYDYHSGFWGVMHKPCLGIIPPYIGELNYPMPTNCSSGDTGIYVNGRQLHQQDLKLLCGRGLPSSRNRFYIIDIFGKVLDEDTGEQLYELGKLAPTVMKNGRGFGMRVPKGMV